MGWLRRLGLGGPGSDRPDDDGPDEPTREPPPALERTAPGLASLFRSLHPDGRHAILDLGSASDRSFGHHAAFARRIRFADVLTHPPGPGGWAAALERVPTYEGQDYDVVLAWNLLDRMGREERPAVVEQLVRLTAPGARLHLVTDVSDESLKPPLRFEVLDGERVRQEALGPPEPAWPTLLPAEVERLLAPFRVEHAFTLRQSLREYVAVRPALPR